MTGGYRVRVVDDAGLRAWRASVPRTAGGNPCAEDRAHVEATGETVLRWHVPFTEGADAGRVRFSWCCPGCGGFVGGYLGDTPVSGWDNPQWVNSGTADRPTLTPSLGCPLWRAGRCPGHWWLRDGELTAA